MIDDTLFTLASLLPFLVGILIGGVMAYFICKRVSSSPGTPLAGNLIDNETAFQMINNFENCTKDDTVSGHIELGVLHEYINQMSTRCTNIGMDLSGLEFYFAKYEPTDAVNPGRTTIVFYPTYNDGANHIPFDPLTSSNGNPVTVFDMSRNARTNAMNNSLCALDRLHMSPPRQPTF